MPTDANGNYALPNGYLATAGTTILPSEHNPPLEDVASGLTARLMRSGAGAMTGQLKSIDGTVGAPGFTFGSALSSGLYKTTNGFGVAIAGALVAEFGAAGLLSGVVTGSMADKAVTLRKLYHPSAAARLLGSNANAALTITGAANNGAGLIRLTVASSATFATGQSKTVSDVTGTTEANGTFTITVVDATHIDLQGSAFVNAYVSGGTIGGGVDELKLGAGLSMTGDTLASTIDASLLPGFRSGLTLSTGGGSGTFGIAAGVANDSTSAALMKLASAFTKTTASWVVGTGNGGLDTGAIANNTWYHVFLIQRPDTGLVDVIFSATATPAAGPTIMPANYTPFRRLGSMKTDGSGHWIKFIQVGLDFLLDVSVVDQNGVTLGTSSLFVLASVPPGVTVKAYFVSAYTSNTAGSLYTVSSPLITAPAVNTPAGNADDETRVNSITALMPMYVLTDTSARIRAVSNGVGVITWTVVTRGWTEMS